MDELRQLRSELEAKWDFRNRLIRAGVTLPAYQKARADTLAEVIDAINYMLGETDDTDVLIR